MNPDSPLEQQKEPVRQKYTTPVLDEHGELHELTHNGALGTLWDTNAKDYSWDGS